MSNELNRWLNTNKVDRLERTRTYIDVPAFAGNALPLHRTLWSDYSKLIACYPFEAPHNFSFTDWAEVNNINVALSGMVICVSYRVVDARSDYARFFSGEEIDNGMIRYQLNDVPALTLHTYPDLETGLDDEYVLSNVPLYHGQRIMKKFRLEFWSNPGISLLEGFRLHTSVRGTQDYRYGTDGPLCETTGLVTTTYVNGVQNGPTYDYNLPLTFPAGSYPLINY